MKIRQECSKECLFNGRVLMSNIQGCSVVYFDHRYNIIKGSHVVSATGICPSCSEIVKLIFNES